MEGRLAAAAAEHERLLAEVVAEHEKFALDSACNLFQERDPFYERLALLFRTQVKRVEVLSLNAYSFIMGNTLQGGGHDQGVLFEVHFIHTDWYVRCKFERGSGYERYRTSLHMVNDASAGDSVHVFGGSAYVDFNPDVLEQIVIKSVIGSAQPLHIGLFLGALEVFIGQYIVTCGLSKQKPPTVPRDVFASIYSKIYWEE